MTEHNDNVVGTWICNCGKANTGKFCVKCGTPRPVAPAPQKPVSDVKGDSPAKWVCACGKSNIGKFCVKCGAPCPPQEATEQKAAQEAAPRQAVEKKAAQEAAPRQAVEEKAAQEAASRQAVEEKAAQEAASRKAEEEKATRQTVEKPTEQDEGSDSSAKTDENKGMMKKAAIGVVVLLLLIGAYFMFGRKKDTPPTPEPVKVETKADTKDDKKQADLTVKEEKPMDPAAKAEKLKEYAEMTKSANAQKKQDATANEKIVFLVDDVKRNGNDLVVTGHFYNGKKNRTITSVKSLQLDIVLRDMDKELLNEKNIKYEQAFIGIRIEPLQDSQPMSLDLPGKAPATEFNNYVVTVHDVHWEGIGY